MLCLGLSIHAQDKYLKEAQATAQKSFAEDTTHKQGWKKGAVYSLGIGQGGSSNWAAGAEKFSFSPKSDNLPFSIEATCVMKSGRGNVPGIKII